MTGTDHIDRGDQDTFFVMAYDESVITRTHRIGDDDDDDGGDDDGFADVVVCATMFDIRQCGCCNLNGIARRMSSRGHSHSILSPPEINDLQERKTHQAPRPNNLNRGVSAARAKIKFP